MQISISGGWNSSTALNTILKFHCKILTANRKSLFKTGLFHHCFVKPVCHHHKALGKDPQLSADLPAMRWRLTSSPMIMVWLVASIWTCSISCSPSASNLGQLASGAWNLGQLIMCWLVCGCIQLLPDLAQRMLKQWTYLLATRRASYWRRLCWLTGSGGWDWGEGAVWFWLEDRRLPRPATAATPHERGHFISEIRREAHGPGCWADSRLYLAVVNFLPDQGC